MRGLLVLGIAALCLLGPTIVAGQTFILTAHADGRGIEGLPKTELVPAGNQIREAAASLVIAGNQNVHWNRVEVVVEAASGGRHVLSTNDIANTRRFVLPVDQLPFTLSVAVGDSTATYEFVRGIETQAPPKGPSEVIGWKKLLLQSCVGQFSVPEYDAPADQGYVLVDPLGNVLQSGLRGFDENDELEVHVAAAKDLLPRLKVERVSAFGSASQLRILGAEEQATLDLQSATGCGERLFVLGDFSSGEAKVRITLRDGDQEVTLGEFTFDVNPLYTAMFTAGGIWTKQIDPGGFILVPGDHDERTIARALQGDTEFLYSLMVTPFVWGRRDIEKTYPVHEHVNPSFGIVLDNISDHFLVGGSVDLPAGFLATLAWHFRKTTVLSESSRLKAGDKFGGEVSELPISTEWQNDTAWGLTLDLRIMVKLLRSILTPAT